MSKIPQYQTVEYDLKKAKVTQADFIKHAEVATIDLSFQSRARWSDRHKRHFINSCFLDMNINKFILVDIELCHKHSISGSDDEKYYKHWLDKGFKFLIIDSNNRTETIKQFIAGKVNVPVADYYIRGNTYKVRKGSDTYETIDENLKRRAYRSIK